MCRSLDFEAAEGSTMLNEVETWAYTLSMDALDSSSKQNRGFCIGKKGKCPANGTLRTEFIIFFSRLTVTDK